MATRILGSVNADSQTIQIILLSHNGRKRVFINILKCVLNVVSGAGSSQSVDKHGNDQSFYHIHFSN